MALNLIDPYVNQTTTPGVVVLKIFNGPNFNKPFDFPKPPQEEQNENQNIQIYADHLYLLL